MVRLVQEILRAGKGPGMAYESLRYSGRISELQNRWLGNSNAIATTTRVAQLIDKFRELRRHNDLMPPKLPPPQCFYEWLVRLDREFWMVDTAPLNAIQKSIVPRTLNQTMIARKNNPKRRRNR